MTSRLSKRKADRLREDLSRIATSGIYDLRTLWCEMVKAPAPRALSARTLRYALAWQCQKAALGPESIKCRRAWSVIEQQRARGAGAADALASEPYTPKGLPEGARLIRSWRGVTHEVIYTKGGYEWQGRRYRSLSGVAKAITGNNRNGPAFFGLRTTEGDSA